MRLEFKLKLNTLTFLILINLILFVLGNILLSFTSSGNQLPLLSLLGGFDFFKIYDGQVWLIITSAFLHFELLHFLINIYSLYRIGLIVEQFYNEKILFSVYIIGAIGASLLTYIVAFVEINSSGMSGSLFSVGASGAIFSLVGLLLGGTLRKSRYGFSLPFSFSDIIPIVLFSLIIGLTPGSNINNWAHLGGLITGIILGLILPHAAGLKSKLINFIEKSLYNISVLLTVLSFIALIVNFIYIIFIS